MDMELFSLMNSIISSNQNAFIPERLITHNIMVAHELFHYLKNGSGHEVVMKALGFKGQWIRLVMSRISIVSYLMLVNGKPDINFVPFRGLRQRDCLSLYLFFICVEGFNSLIYHS